VVTENERAEPLPHGDEDTDFRSAPAASGLGADRMHKVRKWNTQSVGTTDSLFRKRARSIVRTVEGWVRRRPYGLPAPKRVWDEQYLRGQWDYVMSELDELARYMVVAGYIAHVSSSPDVLELGCGQGPLARLLARLGVASYVGVDLSDEAVKQAAALRIPNAEFHSADFELWETDRTFDVVVFSESLYYARTPLETFCSYVRLLRPGGAFVVSMNNYPHARSIWRGLAETFEIVDSTRIARGSRACDVAIIAPRERRQPGRSTLKAARSA
jgi:2-polyprenyl-6-hydroxyphenyl methylase/3-demethylubiquinone-9 3-methyltransferase